MSTHTTSPWEWRIDAHGRGRIYGGGAWIATTWLATHEGNDAPHLPAPANARLIAKTPDLFDLACQLAKLRAGLESGSSAAEFLAVKLACQAEKLMKEIEG